MPFLLISRMLVFIFLLLSITIIFYISFGKMNLISGKFIFQLAQTPKAFTSLTYLYCFFVNTRVFLLLYIWMISWFWLILHVWARGHILFGASDWFILDYTLIFPNLNYVLLSTLFSRTVFGYSWHFCISAIWFILWCRQPFTVSEVMYFLGKTKFCTSGHAQLCCFCHVIQSDMLNGYHSLAHLFGSSASMHKIFI